MYFLVKKNYHFASGMNEIGVIFENFAFGEMFYDLVENIPILVYCKNGAIFNT